MAEGINKVAYRFEGNVYETVYDDGVNPDMLFVDAARMQCFSDCSDEELLYVVVNGRKCVYDGWHPDNEFVFVDAETGKEVWGCAFPQWDH